jgi:hypothetical protein
MHRSRRVLLILSIGIVLLSTIASLMPTRLAHADQTVVVFSENFSNSGCPYPLDSTQQCVPQGWTYAGNAAHHGVEDETSSYPSDWPRRGNPAAYLDTPSGRSAYLQSSHFNLPGQSVLSLLVWGHYDPVSLSIGVVMQSSGTVTILDTLDPPKMQLSQLPQSETYTLGSQFVGQNIAITLACTSNGDVGTFCDYDDILVQTQQPNVVEYPVLHGVYADVDCSKFSGHPAVALWAEKTADAQYQHLELVQGIPANHMRRSLIHLDWGVGGATGSGEVVVQVDLFFGRSLYTPPSQGPSAGMSQQDYSLQRLDAELYHEISHNIPVPGVNGYRPIWFTEALGTWAQSSVTDVGAYTGIKAQMEDVFFSPENAYANPDPFARYGKGALFLWWLVQNYGATGLHRMVSQCFGWNQYWSTETDIDNMGFIPWTGKNRQQLASDFVSSIQAGWRANIATIESQTGDIMSTVEQPQMTIVVTQHTAITGTVPTGGPSATGYEWIVPLIILLVLFIVGIGAVWYGRSKKDRHPKEPETVSVFCVECEAENPTTNEYCGKCGNRLVARPNH